MRPNEAPTTLGVKDYAALRHALARSGWPLQERALPLPEVATFGGGVRRAVELVRGSPVPAWFVEADTIDQAAMERAAARLAVRSPGRAALIIARRDERWSLACCPIVARGVFGWTACARASADQAVWPALLGSIAPAVAALRVGAALERRDVDRRFFQDVRVWSERVTASWSGVPDDEARARLTVTLLARLMFLTFVQAKGWLAGDPRYLARRVLHPEARAIYATVLTPLFFDALNKTAAERQVPHDGIPFLNGGLFEPSATERRFPEHGLPDDVLREGVERIFDRYRFVDHERSFDGGAVDPIMLGAVFERLMLPSQRRRTGTFYTPPALVDEVVDRTLRYALSRRLDADTLQRARAGRLRDADEAARVLEALDGFRVIDPAAGSGAFLLGALDWLAPVFAAALRWTEPERADVDGLARRRVLREHLYGADLSPTAVLLCELRLWLALVAALPDGGPEYAEALPTLAPRVVAGDSLMGGVTSRGPSGADAARLRALRTRLIGATGAEKRALRARLAEEERRSALSALDDALQLAAAGEPTVLTLGLDDTPPLRGDPPAAERMELLRRERAELASDTARPRFDPLLHFSEAFADGGFDAVVGNPPWVRLSRVPRQTRESLRARYRWMHRPTLGGRFGGQPDLSVAFVERALQMTKPEGAVGLVLPAKLFGARYAERMRSDLEQRHTLLALDDRSTDTLFAADAYPALFFARPGGRSSEVTANGARLSLDALRVDTRSGGPWVVGDPRGVAMRRAREGWPTLRQDRAVWMGVKTGANDVFVDPPAHVTTAPCVAGRDLRTMSAREGRRILFEHDVRTGSAHPHVGAATVAYLNDHSVRLRARARTRARRPPHGASSACARAPLDGAWCGASSPRPCRRRCCPRSGMEARSR